MYNSIRLVLILAICCLQFNCSSDDNGNAIDHSTHNVLIGEWLREDFNENTEYKLTFNPDNTVLNTFKITTEEGITSTAQIYNWSIENNLITIENFANNENVTTSYELISNEIVILNNLSEYQFLRQ
ncbi:lipocalin-like protein [Lacinutrix venerupis]|uniref:lipocalin family protein n=1 Tax=Lacinutrix venerupis TaxID=1486034 RepID=UPI000EB4445B|nr:lipocalin family protein [Lacinutrix venerupis]RLJ69045.1 lipocalin-like protein [Lacinutrix venerupis]